MQLRSRLGQTVVAGAVLLAAALAAGCGSDDESPSKLGASNATASTKTSSSESERVAVSMKDNFFEPKDISVERGEAITFAVKNDGQAIHDMHIMSLTAEGKDFMSNTTVQPGESSSSTATFSKAGTLKFQCDFHLPDMVGTITVK